MRHSQKSFDGPLLTSRCSGSLPPPRLKQLDSTAWDRVLNELGGQIHQSWNWGEFKERHGWRVERLAVDDDRCSGIAQVLFKPYGPITTGFIPRGPCFRGDVDVGLPALWEGIGEACRRHRAINLTVEPLMLLDPRDIVTGLRFSESTRRFTPRRSVIVPLLSDEEILKGMRSAGRRQVRKGERNGIVIEDHGPNGEGITLFHETLIDTALRNQFPIKTISYYADFLRTFGEDAILKLAVADGKVAAGLIVGRCGKEATYLFGASSTNHRVRGATALLHFSAMQWARQRGACRYDMWGIPDFDPPTFVGPDQKPIRSLGSDDSGLYQFKVSFGGEIVTYPPSFDVRFRPGAWWVFQKSRELIDATCR